ncbi:TPA: hypothetical protein N2D16_002655 [Clostridium botulinum]|nr:hypothetical protein [Clostridium botulinum]
MVQSSTKPKEIEIQYVKDNIAHIRLRKSIKEITKEENQQTTIIFEYEEVIFDIDNINNLIEQIENHFDLYFDYGQQQMDLQKAKEEAEKKIYNLIKEYKLVDLNNNSQNASMLLTLLMTEIETLKNKVKNLETKAGE